MLRRWSGPAFMVGALAVIEAVSRSGGRPPGAAMAYLSVAVDVAVVYATFTGGLAAGLLSAGLATAYGLMVFPLPGQAVPLGTLALTSSGLALMVDLLKHRAEARRAEEAQLLERRRLEEQIRQSQKMEAVGRLAGGVAHDFNNLLTVIQNYAGFLAQDAPESLRGDVEQIRAASRRAAALTRQLMIFSRKEVAHPVPVDLNRVVSDMARVLRRTLGETTELAAVLSPSGAWVKADPGQLEQVLINLAVNARDAMPDGGRLTVETAAVAVGPGDAGGLAPGPYVRLTVSDTGCGMTPEVAERAFEPFFTTKPRGKGTGLGLATVYGIAAQAGGDVSVETASGKGARFTLRLPATAERPVAGCEAAGGATPQGRGERVLVAEDEEAVRALTCRILSRHGYAVSEARDGAEALEAIGRAGEPVDLLLTDMVMPRLSGRELAERASRLRPGLRLLFMSGYADAEGPSVGRAEVLLPKPFTEEALLARVRGALDQGLPAEAPR